MGGRSSSKSSSANNQRQISLDAKDNQGVAAAAGGNLSITVLDGGAIDAAFDYAEDMGAAAFDFAGAAQGDAFKYAAESQEGALELVSYALDHTTDAYNNLLEKNDSENAQALDQITQYFFGAVVVLGTFYLVYR